MTATFEREIERKTRENSKNLLPKHGHSALPLLLSPPLPLSRLFPPAPLLPSFVSPSPTYLPPGISYHTTPLPHLSSRHPVASTHSEPCPSGAANILTFLLTSLTTPLQERGLRLRYSRRHPFPSLLPSHQEFKSSQSPRLNPAQSNSRQVLC